MTVFEEVEQLFDFCALADFKLRNALEHGASLRTCGAWTARVPFWA